MLYICSRLLQYEDVLQNHAQKLEMRGNDDQHS